MKLVPLVALLAATLYPSAANAQYGSYNSTCREVLGSVRCSGSDGSYSTYRPSLFGNRYTYTDPYGRQVNCTSRETLAGYQTSCY